jgi:hypothetical protein
MPASLYAKRRCAQKYKRFDYLHGWSFISRRCKQCEQTPFGVHNRGRDSAIDGR